MWFYESSTTVHWISLGFEQDIWRRHFVFWEIMMDTVHYRPKWLNKNNNQQFKKKLDTCISSKLLLTSLNPSNSPKILTGNDLSDVSCSYGPASQRASTATLDRQLLEATRLFQHRHKNRQQSSLWSTAGWYDLWPFLSIRTFLILLCSTAGVQSYVIKPSSVWISAPTHVCVWLINKKMTLKKKVKFHQMDLIFTIKDDLKVLCMNPDNQTELSFLTWC